MKNQFDGTRKIDQQIQVLERRISELQDKKREYRFILKLYKSHYESGHHDICYQYEQELMRIAGEVDTLTEPDVTSDIAGIEFSVTTNSDQ